MDMFTHTNENSWANFIIRIKFIWKLGMVKKMAISLGSYQHCIKNTNCTHDAIYQMYIDSGYCNEKTDQLNK